MKPLTEAQTQRAILEYLAARRIWHTRQNSGAIRDITGRPVRFGRAGMADILAFPKLPKKDLTKAGKGQTYYIPSTVWLEVKSPVGKQSPAQKEFQAEVEAEGHVYLVVRSIDQVVEFFEGKG